MEGSRELSSFPREANGDGESEKMSWRARFPFDVSTEKRLRRANKTCFYFFFFFFTVAGSSRCHSSFSSQALRQQMDRVHRTFFLLSALGLFFITLFVIHIDLALSFWALWAEMSPSCLVVLKLFPGHNIPRFVSRKYGPERPTKRAKGQNLAVTTFWLTTDVVSSNATATQFRLTQRYALDMSWFIPTRWLR